MRDFLKNKKTGFTMIEILVVIGVVLIITAFSLLSLDFFKEKKVLDAAADEIYETLKLAQNKTLASESASSFGVYFEADKFVLFRGATYNPAAVDNQTHILNPRSTISEINLNGSQAVVFERLTGTTANSGSIKIELKSDSNQNRSIIIDESGTIDYVSQSAGDSDRLKDTRHLHVVYSADTKSAVSLELFFPNDGFSEIIDYQSQLDSNKSRFNWEGIVVVDSEEQRLRIHSHQLTDTVTLFCFHRDRRFNSKALSISLDGQNLINYDFSGASIRGTSFWASDPEIQ